MAENMKYKQMRDVILAYMVKEDLTVQEARHVLQMCDSELTAWENRSKLVELQKDGEDDGKRN